MDNYAYIIAGLPDLRLEDERTGSFSAEDLIKEIRGLLSARDEAVLDLLLEGCDPEKLNADFYQKALQHGNRFIRDWFRFDLDLRNTVVSYLNDSLGRPEEEDMRRACTTSSRVSSPSGTPRPPGTTDSTISEKHPANESIQVQDWRQPVRCDRQRY